MAAAANIVLADAQATPVNHTFVPLGPDAKGIWWYEDQSAASPIGFNRISISIKRPLTSKQGENSASRVCRVMVALHTPKLEVTSNNTVSGISPAPTISYTLRCATEFIIPERSSLQDRKDVRKFMDYLLAATPVVDAVESLQGIW